VYRSDKIVTFFGKNHGGSDILPLLGNFSISITNTRGTIENLAKWVL
jgi:hypothetical protein